MKGCSKAISFIAGWLLIASSSMSYGQTRSIIVLLEDDPLEYAFVYHGEDYLGCTDSTGMVILPDDKEITGGFFRATYAGMESSHESVGENQTVLQFTANELQGASIIADYEEIWDKYLSLLKDLPKFKVDNCYKLKTDILVKRGIKKGTHLKYEETVLFKRENILRANNGISRLLEPINGDIMNNLDIQCFSHISFFVRLQNYETFTDKRYLQVARNRQNLLVLAWNDLDGNVVFDFIEGKRRDIKTSVTISPSKKQIIKIEKDNALDPYEQRFVIYPKYEKGVPKIALIKTVSETIDINEEVVNSWSIKAKEVEKIFENNENQHPWTNNMVYDSHTRTIPLNSDLINLFMDDN